MTSSSLLSLLKKAGATFYRFPLVMLSALLGVSIGIFMVALDYNQNSTHYTLLIKLLLTSSLGLTLFFSLSLIGERKIVPFPKWSIQLAGLVLLGLYFFFLAGKTDYISNVRYALFTISLHLLCAFAPFIGKKEPNGFWQYNKALFLALLTAGLYSFVLYTGLSIAFVGVHELFDVKVSYKVYSYLFFVIAGLFNTLLFLSKVPSDFVALQASDDYPKGLKRFTQFVLLPLVTLYLFLLYGYEVKILIAYVLPKGYVSYLVLAFSILGILSLLLIHPIRNNSENKWILTFSKWFYLALFPLLILLFVAILTRVFSYGITELRYFVLLLALWLGGIAIYFLLKKDASIKIIPVSLCLLGFLSSFGPWGAFYVASESQVRRFEQVLKKNDLLKDNQMVDRPKALSADDLTDISSVLSFLEERNDLKKVSFYFGPKADSILNNPDPSRSIYTLSELMKLKGLEFDLARLSNQTSYLSFEAKESKALVVKGFDYVIHYNGNNNDSGDGHFLLDGKEFNLSFDKHSGVLCLKDLEADSLQVNVLEVCKDTATNSGWHTYELPAEKLTLATENKTYTSKVVVNNIRVARSSKEDEITYLEVVILLKEK